MDLIFTTPGREDVGVLLDYDMDMAFGADENNFECTIQAAAHCCESGSLLYIEGTEYGGMIDAIQSNGETAEVIYSGRTWHGILNSKVIQPDSGAAYLTVSGEANTVLAGLIDRMGLSGLFEASSEDSGINIRSYQMNRYIRGYDGVVKMLKSAGARLNVTYQGGVVILSAVEKRNYAEDEEFDSDQIDFNVKKRFRTVNHLICLGAGELESRTILHLYTDEKGNISQTQTLFGLDEYADVFDYPNVETEADLMASGKERLQELWEPVELSVDFGAESESYAIGDIVGAVDNITGVSVSAEITKEIVTIKNGQITISYKVGE